MPHDCDALANIVSAVAFYDESVRIASVRNFLYDCKSLVGSVSVEVVEFCLDISEAVDAADNLSSVLSKTVQDYAELVLADFVRVCRDLDCAFSCGERLVSCEECEALCLLGKKTCTQVSVSETNFAVISY